jgi:hypothetical protein
LVTLWPRFALWPGWAHWWRFAIAQFACIANDTARITNGIFKPRLGSNVRYDNTFTITRFDYNIGMQIHDGNGLRKQNS